MKQLTFSQRSLGLIKGLGVTFLFFGGLLMSSIGAADTIRVGFIDSMTGPIASLGIPYDKGMKAAYSYQSSVAGYDIKVYKLDDESNPSKASRDARKLINEKHVDIIIGTAGTPGSLAIAAVSRDEKVPYISLAQAAVPSGQDRSWLVNVPQPASIMMAAVAKYMKKKGVKTIGFIGFSDASGDTFYKATVDGANKYGMKVIADERFARSDTSVIGQVLKLKAKNPDAVVDGATGTPAALPILGLKKVRYEKPIYGDHGIISSEFIKVAGSAANGLIAPAGPVTVAEQLPKDYPTRAIGLKFRRLYEKVNGGQPHDAFSSYSFDSWLVFLNAAKRVGDKVKPGTAEYRLALRNALNSTHELVGTHGVYNFSADRVYGVDARAAVIVQLEKGQWKLLETSVGTDK